jgi:hypothetical protein
LKQKILFSPKKKNQNRIEEMKKKNEKTCFSAWNEKWMREINVIALSSWTWTYFFLALSSFQLHPWNENEGKKFLKLSAEI